MIKSTDGSRKILSPNEKAAVHLRTAACPGKLPVSAMIILPAPVEIEAAARIFSGEAQSAVPIDGTLRMLPGGDRKFRREDTNTLFLRHANQGRQLLL
ncbi:hypothetical protein H8A99_23430 [Bradyrhizobium sp. Arg68]|uniref:hypothetical protein n=1 Tax=Bradyrhizobium ivorense TaxID=2511166 RepID=UPI001E3EE9DF|nr:hypothetical protein [Bradyrhizobium ivorense]MCC8939345.1 hypothetical protein [Bradyrhizobium ivorense]